MNERSFVPAAQLSFLQNLSSADARRLPVPQLVRQIRSKRRAVFGQELSVAGPGRGARPIQSGPRAIVLTNGMQAKAACETEET
jgi:hypothetical protein